VAGTTKGPSRFPCSVVGFIASSGRAGAYAGRRSNGSGAGHLLDGISVGSGAGRTAAHGAPGALRARVAEGKNPVAGRTAPHGARRARRARVTEGKVGGARSAARGGGGTRVSGPARNAGADEVADRDAARTAAGTVAVWKKERRERRASYVAGMPIAGTNQQQEHPHALVLTFTAGADSMVEIQRRQARYGLPTLLSGGQVPYDLLTLFLRGRCGRMPVTSPTLWSRGRGRRFPTTPLTSFAGCAGPLRPAQPLDCRDRCSLPSPAGRCKAPARTRMVARVDEAASPARGGLQRPPDPDWNVAGCKPCRTLVAPEATVAWRQLLERPRRSLPYARSFARHDGTKPPIKKTLSRLFHDGHSRSKSGVGGACAASLPGRESGDPLMDCAAHPLRLLIRPLSGTSWAAPSSAGNDTPRAAFAEKSPPGHSFRGPAPRNRWPAHRKQRRNLNHKEQGK